jgi:UDP-glucose 4-epimerase
MRKNKMKIGITGVAGMLGSHLSEILIEDGHEVIGIDDLSYGSLSNLEKVINNSNFQFMNFDVRINDLMRHAFISCDMLVHLAAVKKVVESQSSFETLDVNVSATKNILELARVTGAKVIFASTSDIYGSSTNIPFKEDQDLVLGQSLAKRWAYAASKLYCEHLCVSYYKDFNVSVTMLRYFGGFSEKSAFLWSGGHVPIFIDQIMNKKPITIHGDGKQTRSMGHASDLANGTYLAMKNIDICAGEIINIGNDEEISVIDSAYMIADEMGVNRDDLNIEFIPEEEIYGTYKDLRRRRPDLSKAKRLIDYSPKISLTEAIQVVVRKMKDAHAK